MKFIDRVPAKPNKRKIVDVDTGKITSAYISYDDEPINEGTPFSAANLNAITNDIIRAINCTEMGILRNSEGDVLYRTCDENKYPSYEWVCPDSELKLGIGETKEYDTEFIIPVDKPYNYRVIAAYAEYDSAECSNVSNVQIDIQALDNSASANLQTTEGNKIKFYDINHVNNSYTSGYGAGTDMPSLTIPAHIIIENRNSGNINSGLTLHNLRMTMYISTLEKKTFLNEI